MKIKLLATLIFCLLFIAALYANNPESSAILDYIEDHYEIAIEEMKRSGIPASILLAQAIISSENGLAEITVENNNHFAVKCGLGWKGETFFKNRKKSVAEECFRAYPNAASSFSDYTNLLMEDRSCRVLFQNSYYDYQSWAEGIQQCLYAKEKDYAEQVIKLIKKFDLAQYDSPETFSPVIHKPIIGYEFEIN